MRSIYSHLEAVQSFGEEISLLQKPTHRSSAIFPVQHNDAFSSKVIFMGYWLLKRNIREIGILYSLRDENGKLISRRSSVIDSHKAYSLSLNEFGDRISKPFIGSLEVEIFSTRDLVFPYPAFVLVYYNDSFSTAVHTVGRIYNDIEDLSDNEEYIVRESGFDIYSDPNIRSFVAFTNGPEANLNAKFQFELNGDKGKISEGSFELGTLSPYQTVFVDLSQKLNLARNLIGKMGSVKLAHNLRGFFPRFVAGNLQLDLNQMSITHTYYDCSGLDDVNSFWNRKDELFNDSAVAIPLYIVNGMFTQVAIYPIFSPSDFEINCEFYTSEGEFLGTVSQTKSVLFRDEKHQMLDLGQVCDQAGIHRSAAAVVNLFCNWNDKTRIPTRVKFGLNVGFENRAMKLPSNICFAPSLGNPKILEKKGTFRWAPFINIGNSEIAITNCSTLKRYDRIAEVDLKFFRETDDQVLERKIVIAANGAVVISVARDKELETFLQGRSGWLTMQTSNPFIYGYYFDFFESGAVAADHIF